MVSKPLRVVRCDGRHGIDRMQKPAFFCGELGLKQVEQPFLGARPHDLGHVFPQLVFDVVRPQHNLGVAQPSNGRDVRCGEQGLQEDDVVHVHPQRLLDGTVHFRHVKPAQMVALSRDHVAQGVPEIEFRVCKNGLNGGGFEVGVVDLVLEKRVLVRVKRQHLYAVPLRQQPGGQAVHGDTPSTAGRGGLRQRMRGSIHLGREIRTTPSWNPSTFFRCAPHQIGQGRRVMVLNHMPDQGERLPTLTNCSPSMDRE